VTLDTPLPKNPTPAEGLGADGVLRETDSDIERPTSMTVHIRKVLPGALALAAALTIGLAGIAQAASPRSHHHRHHHHATTHHSKIPQHNGGDQDADNNGGPSDGDGNI
jgi:hypothetical protein